MNAERYEDVRDKIVKYIKQIYEQGIDDALNDSESFEDGFEADVLNVLNDILLPIKRALNIQEDDI